MSTARAILLEVKRRLGDTNTPYPDETDALAYLNKALQGIHNYGVYLKSSRLKKTIELTSDASTGSVAIADGIARILGVADKDLPRVLKPLDSIGDVIASLNYDENYCPYYTVDKDTISLYPSPTEAKHLIISYVPRYAKITLRSSDVPFSPELDNAIEMWTIALIAGKQTSVSDIEFATMLGLGNTLSRYFRGLDERLITGQGPW